MTGVLLDTSVLIGAQTPSDLEGAISAATLAELHFGMLFATDLAIAATANVHEVPLLTADTADLAIIDDLVEVQSLG